MNHSHFRLNHCVLAIWFAAMGAHGSAAETKQPELPPQEIIDAVVPHEAEPPVFASVKKPDGATPDPLCGLALADLNVSRGDKTRTYKILIDPSAGNPPQPANAFF